MDLNLDLLSIQNPWWSNPPNPLYQEGSLWRPAVLDQLDLNKDKIYCFYGFKGAGKTTLMKLLVKKLIEQDKANGRNIFFYSCHNLDSYEQLNEAIKLFLNQAASGRRYIFIDEVGMVKNWRRGLDYLIKAGKLKNVSLMLSSSSAAEEKKAESGAMIVSRTVKGLSFREFGAIINPALFKKITVKNYPTLAEKLEYYLDVYFLTGGMISAINDYKARGAVSQLIYGNFLHWFLAYVARSGRDVILTRQILEKLIINLGRPLGFKTLARKTKAKTHLTAAGYVKLLESMFAIKTVYQAGGQLASRKAKKVYFQDPFIFWLFYSYIHGALDYWQFSRQRLHDRDVFSHLVDNVVLSQLVKDEKNKISYWRDSVKKKEINFIVARRKKRTPILIRYDRQIAADDKNFFKLAGFNRGVIISKDKLKAEGNFKILPLSYFLLFYRS